jgi:hypothetical protein
MTETNSKFMPSSVSTRTLLRQSPYSLSVNVAEIGSATLKLLGSATWASGGKPPSSKLLRIREWC